MKHSGKHTQQKSDPSKKSESKRRPSRSLPQGSLRVTRHSAVAASVTLLRINYLSSSENRPKRMLMHGIYVFSSAFTSHCDITLWPKLRATCAGTRSSRHESTNLGAKGAARSSTIWLIWPQASITRKPLLWKTSRTMRSMPQYCTHEPWNSKIYTKAMQSQTGSIEQSMKMGNLAHTGIPCFQVLSF
jgi:hypothetical protein